jgi:hypothetical protein
LRSEVASLILPAFHALSFGASATTPTHKNERWQAYATGTVPKEVLSVIPAAEVCKACLIVNPGTWPEIALMPRSMPASLNLQNASLPLTTVYPPHLTEYCHSQFSKFPASSLALLRCYKSNKSDFRQIPWILCLTLYRAMLLSMLSVTKPGLFC